VPALGAASQREYVDSLRWFIEDVAPEFRS